VRNLLISVKLDWVFSWGIFFVHKLFIPYRNDLSLITSSLKYFLSYSYQCLFFPIKLFWTYLLLSNLVSYFFLKYCSCRVLLIGYFKSVRFHAHSPQIVHFMPINMPRKSKTTYIAYFGGFVSSSIYFSLSLYFFPYSYGLAHISVESKRLLFLHDRDYCLVPGFLICKSIIWILVNLNSLCMIC
jgi:hypothetical protein